MATVDKKKYSPIEPVLNFINGEFISLSEKDKKRNNAILKSILEVIIEQMCEIDSLFKKMFERIFYGGSFYDGLRVGEPNEFDLDLLLRIPVYAQPILKTNDNIPGFVTLRLENFDGFKKQPEALLYPKFEKILDADHYLDRAEVLKWMEGTLQRCFNNIGTGTSNERILKTSEGTFRIIYRKGGPALTLNVSEDKTNLKMDVDLVTCFVFNGDKWPEKFRKNPVTSKTQFFIVPKAPKVKTDKQKAETVDKLERYWRLSFQEQERVLIDNKLNLKPTVKLLKKLRDTSEHKLIASYYIKTVILWLNDTKEPDFWKNPLSVVFFTVLREYQEFIAKGHIPYYWYDKNNLLSGKIEGVTAINYSNYLKGIINEVDRKIDDPKVIAKFLLSKKLKPDDKTNKKTEYQVFLEKYH